MPNLKRNLIALLVASSCLVTGQESIAEVHIVMPNSDDIELSEQEKRDLAIVAASLIPNPSEPLLESIDSGDGLALLDDQRDEPEARYPLIMTIIFPEVAVNEYKKQVPKIVCEGSFDPLVWDDCRESSRWSLKVAGYDYVRINRESITLENIAEMYASLDSAELESPTGASIRSRGVHHILFNSRSGLYHLIGNASSGEQFFIYLRAIEDINGAGYEIAEWSCQ